MATRHKCFISYHHDDQTEVNDFIKTFADERDAFIARAVGVMAQDIINSYDKDYVMRRIREEYLTDSTVTILLVGKCTKHRKYVDWEIASTLRNDPNNKRSGLLAINLPSAGKNANAPDRLNDNWGIDKDGNQTGYARYYLYPSRKDVLAKWIQDAFDARILRPSLIDNTRDLRKNNGFC
ncbi:MTH538 TIR-like domain containing protein [Fimbriimonadaceae bacterium]